MARRSATPRLLPLLRSATQAALLERLLLGPKENAYTVADLSRSLGVTDMSVRRELDRMMDAGIVVRERVGRQGLYRADEASPLFEPLRELVERSVGVETLLRDAMEHLPGVEAAAIFGSWARGRVDAESDIDVLVVGDFDYSILLSRVRALQERTGREINVVAMRPGDLEDELQAGSGFIRDVLSSPLTVLVGEVPTA